MESETVGQTSYSANRLVDRAFPGVNVALVDYHWEPGADIIYDEHEVVLRFRLAPDRVEAVGVLGNFTFPLGRLMMRTATKTHSRAAGDTVERASVVDCRYDPKWLQDLIGQQEDWSLHPEPADLDMHNGDLHNDMRRIATELTAPSFASDALLEALAHTAAIDLFRHRLSHDARLQIQDTGGLCPIRLKRVRELVECSLDTAPTISDLAQDIGISPSHLRRLFKNSTGQTLHEYIEDVRVAQAKEMLANSQLRLKVISHRVGFSHPSAFSAAFRKATGESPRDYRERLTMLSGAMH
jgi:AraC family transcriptional regulator